MNSLIFDAHWTYRVTEAQGFKRYLLSSVTVTASGTIRVDAVLELGSVSESVQVSADERPEELPVGGGDDQRPRVGRKDQEAKVQDRQTRRSDGDGTTNLASSLAA